MGKKLTVGKKIVLGFTSVLVLMLIVGFIGFSALQDAAKGFKSYREMARDANLAGQLQASLLMVQKHAMDYIITGDEAAVSAYEKYSGQKNRFLEDSKQAIQDPDRAANIQRIDNKYTTYEDGFEQVKNYMDNRDRLVNEVLNVKGPAMEDALTEIMFSANRDDDVTAAYQSGRAMRNLLLARLYVMKFLDTNDSAAVDRVKSEFTKMKTELDVLDRQLQNPERRRLLESVLSDKKTYETRFAEVVQLIKNRNKVISDTMDATGAAIAGDVEDVKLDIKSEQDTIGPRLQAANQRAKTSMGIVALAALIVGIGLATVITLGITRPLREIIDNLSTGSEEVASASSQVSTASQQLAEGSSEQASTLEQTASSLEEMAAQTRQNADNADQADMAVKETAQVVETGVSAMERMNSSINEIKNSADETSRIIKTIDDIAFQTNLLALNAAVEAARAGEAGKGFAVVAEEVRKLAQRSAEAAQNTARLIEKSQENAVNGVGMADEVAGQLDAIKKHSEKVNTLIAEITAASKEQAEGIEQVNTAASQMDKVVQQNAADSEESASAAEELTAQAGEMEKMVAALEVVVGGRRQNDAQPVSGKAVEKAANRQRQHAGAQRHPNAASSGTAQTRPAGNRRKKQDHVIPLDEDEFSDF
ncbi:MAG: HAMP domain-containing methyl-accepting chemotaxis protein [Thermodesulfobacteriota bacterium]